MVNRQMRSQQLLTLIRKVARKQDMTIDKIKSKGKGSHQEWKLLSSDGTEVARFGLTDHPKDLSWTILNRLEKHLAPWFGSNWMEKR